MRFKWWLDWAGILLVLCGYWALLFGVFGAVVFIFIQNWSLYWIILISGFVVVIALGVLSIVAKRRSAFMVCPECNTRIKIAQAHQSREDKGYEDGWHSAYETVNKSSSHKDASGTFIGSSEERSGYYRTVPHRTFYWTDHYECPQCSEMWSQDCEQEDDL